MLLQLSEGDLGYAHDNPIVKHVEFNVLAGLRIGLLGHNGAGKSTLIKTLANAQPLLRGERSEGAHLRIGYFAQHQLEALDLNASCALHLQRITPAASEQQVRNFLGGFGFSGDRAFETITHFSGGEKARLALAIVAWQKPNLLLLDEPTNHLDLEMRHALTMALQNFEGAIVVISHDRHLLKNTVDQFFLVDAGSISEFDGTLKDYENWLTSENDGKIAPKKSTSPTTTSDKKEKRQDAAALREKLKPLTNAIKKLEATIERLTATLTSLEEKLADSSLYDAPNDRLNDLLKQQSDAHTALQQAEEAWMQKSEECEALSSSQK